MEIHISDVEKVPGVLHKHGITHVLSLLRGKEFNELLLPRGFDRSNWLCIEMDDTYDPDSPLAPTKEKVARFLDWAKKLPRDSKLLVHCRAGISRSTAAALAIKVQESGIEHLPQAVLWLLDHRPIACPNILIAEYADQLLGTNGKLHDVSMQILNSRLISVYGFDKS